MEIGDLVYCTKNKFQGIITKIKHGQFGYIIIEKGNIICHTTLETLIKQ